MDNFISDEELNKRLAKADPANGKVPPFLEAQLITQAANSDKRVTLAERFARAQRQTRQFILGGSLTASAAAIALVLVVSGTPTAPLIQLAAGSNQGLQASESSSSSAMDSTKMMMPYASYTYKAGSALTNDTGSDKVYKIVRDGSPEDVLTKVANLFGVKGEISKVPEFSKDNPSYFLSETKDPYGYDSVNPVVSLWWSGTGSWNYSNPVSYPQSVCESTGENEECASWSEIKPTPELLPSREAAVAKALEIFNATGLAATESDLRIYSDEWGINIMSSLKVDGNDTNIEWYIGWSSNGELSYAGGQTVKVQEMGTFDTISQIAAVDRIPDWRWSGSPSAIFYEQYQPNAIAYSDGISTRDNAAVEEPLAVGSESGESTEGSEGTGEVIEPDMTIEPSPIEPEIVELEIVEAVSTMLTIWDANGDVWLVPGYILVNSQGWFSAIISLIEGVIALPEETEYEIMPMDDSVKVDQ
jgi:hypothetical protein